MIGAVVVLVNVSLTAPAIGPTPGSLMPTTVARVQENEAPAVALVGV